MSELTVNYRYRVSKRIYTGEMAEVVSELCDIIERLEREKNELDDAFFRWRQEHREPSPGGDGKR